MQHTTELPFDRLFSWLLYFVGISTALYSHETDIPQGAGRQDRQYVGAVVKRILRRKCDALPRGLDSCSPSLQG